MNWAPFAARGILLCGVWVPNMRRKDAWLAPYREFEKYQATRRLFIPYVV